MVRRAHTGRWPRLVRLSFVAGGAALAVAACGGGSSASLSSTGSGAGGYGSSGGGSALAPQAPGSQQNPQAPASGGSQSQSGATANRSPLAPVAPGNAAPGGARPAAGVPAPPPGTVPAPPPPGQKPQAPSANGANFASDVGVTATTITFGAINLASATRSLGPVVSEPTQKITEGALDYINAHGGIHGRKLQLLTCDDGGDVTRARACYEKLKTQVFAFLPAETFLTDVIHPALAQDHVPFMSWGWFQSEYTDPYMFPCHANGIREAIALTKWVAENKRPKTVGIMYLNVSEDIHAKDAARAVLQRYGIKDVQDIAMEWDSPDESQHVLSMRVANPEAIFTFTWAAPLAKFFRDAGGQNWSPPLGYWSNHVTTDPGFGPVWGDYIKDHDTGITSFLIPEPNQEPVSPGNVLWEQVSRQYSGLDVAGLHFRYAMGHHISQAAFVCTILLPKAIEPMGANVTRPGFMNQLETQQFDTGMGVTLKWPHNDHGAYPYQFNKEFLYAWITGKDGYWDERHLYPDPVYQSCPDASRCA
jgi:ABC-type branched-subunit amino acid transport system substrate-binding protein